VLNGASDTSYWWETCLLALQAMGIFIYLTWEQPLLACYSGGNKIPPTYPKW